MAVPVQESAAAVGAEGELEAAGALAGQEFLEEVTGLRDRPRLLRAQEIPGATISVVGGSAFTAGASRRFPTATEMS